MAVFLCLKVSLFTSLLAVLEDHPTLPQLIDPQLNIPLRVGNKCEVFGIKTRHYRSSEQVFQSAESAG